MSLKPARKKGAVKLKTNKNSSKKRLKRVLTTASIVIGAFLFLSGYSLVKLVNHNLASALTPNEVDFEETGYPTVLYVTAEDLASKPLKINSISFKIYDLDGERVFTYDIPLDYEIDMPGRLGMEQLKNIFLVSDLEENSEKTNESEIEKGMESLNKSLLPIFGLKAERYVLVDPTSAPKISKFWETGDLALFIDKNFITGLPSHVKSNLSVKEINRLATFTRSLPSDRLINNPYLKSYISDTEVIDQEIRELMLLSPLSKEGYSVAILNATNKPGFAAFGARVVANNGGRVVAVNNSDQEIKESVIISDKQDSLTVRKFSSIFGIDNVITKSKAQSLFRDNEIDRADVIIVLGFDLADTL